MTGFPKPSRIDDRVKYRRDNDRQSTAFRQKVWQRDHGCCRCCGRAVLRTIELDPRRGECHHIVRREHRATRYDPRNGVLLCLSPCHEAVTRHEIRITGQHRFTIEGQDYLNADRALSFRRTR